MKKTKPCLIIIAYGLLLPFASLAGQKQSTLTVHVKGAKPGTGQAFASLFSSPENYLKEPISKQRSAVDGDGQVQFVFHELKPGKYAVSIVYDEDGNGKLNTGFLGIPSEPVGFSNNAKGLFGPPSFDKAAFRFPDWDVIEITVGKAKD